MDDAPPRDAAASKRAPTTGPSALDDDDARDTAGFGLEVDERAPAVEKPAAGASPRLLSAARTLGSSAAVGQTPGAGPSVDELEVSALAAFGPPPSTTAATVSYAVRTFVRMRQLEKELAREQEAFGRHHRYLQQRMAGIVDAVRQMAPPEGAEGLELVLRPIDEAEQVVSMRSIDLDAAKQAYASGAGKLEELERSRARDREGVLAERKKAQVLFEDATAQRAGNRAALTRVERDLTGVHKAAAAAAGASEFATPEHARRITELEADRARLTAAVAGHEGSVANAKRAVDLVEGKLRQLDRAGKGLDSERRHLDRAATTTQRARVTEVEHAQFLKLDAYEAALRRLVLEHGAVVGADRAAEFAELDRARSVAERELEKLRRATTAYDVDSFRRGAALGIGALVAFLVALVFVLSR